MTQTASTKTVSKRKVPHIGFDYDQYLRVEHMPHLWCPGCGHGMVMKSLIRAIHQTGWNRDDIVIISGIGCAARIPTYLDFDTVHTTHGRALPFATGVRLANPDLHVIIATGDGDSLAIGGNHFIHACRRNIDMTLVLFNNGIYGMTGGQYSPSTPRHDRSATSPYGNVEPHFDISGLATSSGAGFVARGDTYHLSQLDKMLYRGLMHPGFSVVEVMEGCFTTHGRRNRNRYKSNLDMLMEQKNMAIELKDDQTAHSIKDLPEDIDGPNGPKYLHGVIYEKQDRDNYLSLYDEVTRKAKKGDSLGRVPDKGNFKHIELRFAGSGGQGLILSGIILADAAVEQGWNVAQSQSYGPEARGGSSKCDLVLSHKKIEFPKATRLDVLVALTQEACDKYGKMVRDGGILLVDASVDGSEHHQARLYRLPIISTAKKIGSPMSANVVALGCLHTILRPFPKQAMENAVSKNVPEPTIEKNLEAFKAGRHLVKTATRKKSRKNGNGSAKNEKNGKKKH